MATPKDFMMIFFAVTEIAGEERRGDVHVRVEMSVTSVEYSQEGSTMWCIFTS
jgi:hypothetical protein